MKIIEAMKELKLIDKKMKKNIELINEYAALPDNERLPFETRAKQIAQVKSLIQANIDLMKNYLHIKQSIENTNLVSKVAIYGKEYTISELLIIKRNLASVMIATYNALNDSQARRKIQQMSVRGEKPPIVDRFYDETDKNAGLNQWEDLYHTIDARLEVTNASTDLIEI